ncbi:hypothetical protein GWI33_011596 [Rhynchophorus ferrugineus]|uniref:Odorant receptor n=1 Tax=Rhynchophorus ferrugineus TaxID=354439 RepID=A0A834ICM7_RHYFE|nr:hypothetical protein GWI33_011596 [Rhynchophorus ferrugineus]
MCQNFMLSLGTWKLTSNMSSRTRFWYHVYAYTFFGIFIVTCIFTAVKLVVMICTGGQITQVIEHMAKITLSVILIIKCRIYGGEEITKLIGTGMRDTNRAGKSSEKIRNIILENVKFCNNVNLVVVVLTIMAGSFYDINVFVEAYQFEKQHNFTIRPKHLMAVYYPFEENFYTVFICENVLVIYITLLSCAYQTLLNSIMVNAVAQIKVIQYHFGSYDEHGKNQLTEIVLQKKLKSVIHHHQDLIKTIEDLNDSINIAVLIEYYFSSVMIASMIIQFMNGVHMAFYGVMLVQVSFQLLLFGICADEIRTQSEAIATNIYFTNWYERSIPTKKLILFSMMRSAKPLMLTIGPFGAMTAESVIAIFKGAYSYLSLLSQGK